MPDTTTSRPAYWGMIVAVAVGGAFYLAGQHIAAKPQTFATISVSADAHVSAMPDIAQLSFGVTVDRQATAKGAIDGVTRNMNAIMAAVKKGGVEEKDITTQNFWLTPSYDYNDGRQTLRGYTAGETLSVKVRNLDSVGSVLSAATDAGANQAGDIQFSIDEPDALQAKARAMAIEKAKQKASVLAASLGVSLGKLQSFGEGYTGGTPPPMMMRAEGAMAKDAMATSEPVPVATGEQEVTSQVTLTYELQ